MVLYTDYTKRLNRRQLIAGIVLCAVIIFFINKFNFYDDFYDCSVSQTQLVEQTTNGVIEPRNWLMQKQEITTARTIPCLRLAVEGIHFPVCAYHEDDDSIVSVSLHSGKVYEQDVVERILRMLRTRGRDDIQLVDIGANLGSFALPVSYLTSVVAVEPNLENMYRLAMSVVLGSRDNNITLVYAAVSNQITTVDMAYDPINRGHSMVSVFMNVSYEEQNHPRLRCLKRPIRTILLDDLLPLMTRRQAIIKIDVEGHEVNVFTEETASSFFEQINVPLVIMEWMHYVPLSQKNRKFVVLIEKMLTFFKRRNYQFFDGNNRLLPSNWELWPKDIFVKKNDFLI